MNLLNDLNNCQNADDLEEYISANYLLLTDYLQFSKQSELKDDKKLFKSLSLKLKEFESLDYSKNYNIAFVNGILNASLRLRERFIFREFFRILQKNNLTISKLVDASSLFMLDGNRLDEFIDKYKELHEKLELAFLEEEDGYRNVISVLVNYYIFLIKNFNDFAHDRVESIRNKLVDTKQDKIYEFNQVDIIDEILGINIYDTQTALLEIDNKTDEYLNRRSFRISSRYIYAIESDTDYTRQLGVAPYNIERVLSTSKMMYKPIANDKIFNSLQRGVNVIQDSKALLCYLFSYGNMHKAKLKEAISYIDINNDTFRVIDWGCGQAIGSLYLIEYLKNKNVNVDQYCRRIILIEPSEIALKRAALHLDKTVNEVVTYCKDIDSIVADDIIDIKMSTIHIFSNILDIDNFYMSELIEKIKASCKGINYFIIVSPRINEIKTERIDAFVNEFKKLPSFIMKHSSQASSGEWLCSWTKIIRVFEINL